MGCAVGGRAGPERGGGGQGRREGGGLFMQAGEARGGAVQGLFSSPVLKLHEAKGGEARGRGGGGHGGGGHYCRSVLWAGEHSLHCAGPDGHSSAAVTAEQLTKLLAFHDTLSTWAVDGRHAKHKKAEGATQVSRTPWACLP